MAHFRSVKEALGYMYAARRGPSYQRAKYERVQESFDRPDWVHVVLGAIVYGPRDRNCLGVIPGGFLDDLLRAWSTSQELAGQIPTLDNPSLLHLYRTVRPMLIDYEMMEPIERIDFESVNEKLEIMTDAGWRDYIHRATREKR